VVCGPHCSSEAVVSASWLPSERRLRRAKRSIPTLKSSEAIAPTKMLDGFREGQAESYDVQCKDE